MSEYDKDGFDNDGRHRLHIAAIEGDLKAVQDELKSGTDIDVESRDGLKRTPLHVAAYCNKPEIVKFLVSKGANLNKQDRNQDSPLIIATRYGREGVVKILLEAKADATIKGLQGETALEQAQR